MVCVTVPGSRMYIVLFDWCSFYVTGKQLFFPEFVRNDLESRYRTYMDPVSDDS